MPVDGTRVQSSKVLYMYGACALQGNITTIPGQHDLNISIEETMACNE